MKNRHASQSGGLSGGDHPSLPLLLFYILFTLSIVLGIGATAERLEESPKRIGVWQGAPAAEGAETKSWEAHWIWMEDSESNMMLARRSFHLGKIPKEARLRISASSRYQLYVNARYLARGPARTASHHQSFDEFEISGWLRRGLNTLAARVHFQEGHLSYHHRGRAGLLVQLDFPSSGEVDSILSDGRWKVHSDPAWSDQAPRMSRFHLDVCDRVDLRKEIRDWTALEFDDSAWKPALSLMRTVGWPLPPEEAKPQPLTPPWTALVARDLPYLEETLVQATHLLEARLLEEEYDRNSVTLADGQDEAILSSLARYREGSGPLVIPGGRPGKNWFLLFDFGQVVSGRPRFEIEGAAGGLVRVHSAPYVLENGFSSEIVDSRFIDQVILSGKRDRWEANYWKPVRFLGLEFREVRQALALHSLGIRTWNYPFRLRGDLETPTAPWLERYWRASAETIRVCTTDAYTDNYRERRQYAQTGYYAALGNYWIFGDTALQRRYLQQVAQEQQANGLMPAYAPLHGDDYMVILDSNCLWIRGLRNFLLYSGDEETSRSLLPAAGKLLELLHSYTSPTGLIEDPPYPYWLDHARIDRRGANFALNAHYLGALEDFAEVLDWLGEGGPQRYRARAEFVRRSLRDAFWNVEEELFCDAVVGGEQSSMYSEHSNGLALALGIATNRQAKSVATRLLQEEDHDYIRRESGLTMVTPAMSYFLHYGLCRYGYAVESLEMFRSRFDRMLQQGSNGTFWEEWWLDGTGRSGSFAGGRTRSDAQTESAFAPALFGEFVLGLRPLKPGLEEILLSKPAAGGAQVAGTLPTPRGGLQVSWDLGPGRGGSLQVRVPLETRVRLDLRSFDLRDHDLLWVDGESLGRSERAEPSLILEPGSHEIRF